MQTIKYSVFDRSNNFYKISSNVMLYNAFTKSTVAVFQYRNYKCTNLYCVSNDQLHDVI